VISTTVVSIDMALEGVRDGHGQGASASGGGQLLAPVLEAAPDCVFVIDAQGTVVELNAAAERTFGYTRAQALGSELASLIVPPGLRERHRGALRSYAGPEHSTILDRRLEFAAMRADGSEFPVELTIAQVSAQPLMFAGYLRDVSERRKEAEGKDLLASASAAFDSSLDPRETMRTIAHTAVPRLAELCVIDLIREDGMIGDSVVASVDEALAGRLEQLRAREPLDPSGSHPVAGGLRARDPLVIHDLTDEHLLSEVAQSEEHRTLIEEAGYRSAVVLKLAARGRILGALSFLHVREGSSFDPDHMALMQDLASRAATALDNATLYADRARIAHTLQSSLLPDALPPIAGVDLACTFHPVGEGIEMGGDFYDAFQARSGCWLIVGDVCGKGTEAAGLTALVRHSIRALSFVQSEPAEVLHAVNDAMRSHELDGRFATVVVARLDLDASPARALIASAGHPQPVLLGPRGEDARSLPVAGTLLGIFEEMSLQQIEVELPPGASLIFYTDGLLDAGAPDRELSSEELCGALSAAVERTPQALVGQLRALALARGAGHLRDDIAILAARIEP
jgi:PAS domain S-box-containing protein